MKQIEKNKFLNNEQTNENVCENKEETIIMKDKDKKEELQIMEKKQINMKEDIQLNEQIESQKNNQNIDLTQKVQMLNTENKQIINETKTERTYKSSIPDKEEVSKYLDKSKQIDNNKPLENNIEIKKFEEKPTSNITTTIVANTQINAPEKEENPNLIKESITSIDKILKKTEIQPKSTKIEDNSNQLIIETEIKYKDVNNNKNVTKESKSQNIKKEERHNEFNKKEPSIDKEKEYRQVKKNKDSQIVDNNKIIQNVENVKDKSNFEIKETNKQEYEIVTEPLKQQIQSIMIQEEHFPPNKNLPKLNEMFEKDSKVNKNNNENVQKNITSIKHTKIIEDKQINIEQDKIVPFPKENILQNEGDLKQGIMNERKQASQNKEQGSPRKYKPKENSEEKELFSPIKFSNNQIYEANEGITKNIIKLNENINKEKTNEPIFKSELLNNLEENTNKGTILDECDENLINKNKDIINQNNIIVILEKERQKEKLVSDNKDAQKEDILNELEQETIEDKNKEIKHISKEKKDDINQIKYLERIELLQRKQDPKINSEFNQQKINNIDNTHVIKLNENLIKNEYALVEPIYNTEQQKQDINNSNKSKIIPQIKSPEQLLKNQSKQTRKQESQDENIQKQNILQTIWAKAN